MHTTIGRLLRCTDQVGYVVRDNICGDPDQAERNRLDIHTIIKDVPHYVADAKIQRLAESKAVFATLDAMAKAGICHLPFDPIMIEMTGPQNLAGRTIHNFVRLQSQPIAGSDAVLDDGTPVRIDTYAYIIQYQIDPNDTDNILIASLPLETPIAIQYGRTEGKPFTVLVQTHIVDEKDRNAYVRMEYDMHLVVAEAMTIAMMMLNTKGIEHLRVDTTKLNKARLKRNLPGKPRINPYTVLRIGHVYDRQGNAHSVGGSGRHMPVHWRAGHVRMVPYGPLRAEVRPARLRFIQPCLVNFDPLKPEPVPVPKHEVTV